MSEFTKTGQPGRPTNIKVLEVLLGKLEAAEGPGIVLETQIAIALRDGADGYPDFPLGSFRDGYVQADMGRDGSSVGWKVPPYTASLDSALALVERVLPGTLWELYRIKAGGFMANLPDVDSGFGPTPALALLAATVRALISNADSAGPQDDGGRSSSASRLDASCAPPESGGQAGGGDHLWHERFSLTCCKRCGIVKRRNGLNKPCPGPVRIGLRNRAGADRFEP